MTEINPLVEMVKKWVDDDDVEAAIHKMDIHAFNLMRRYPDGVPTIVLTTAVEKALSYTGQFLLSMMVDMQGDVQKWNATKRLEQLALGQMALRLVSGEAWIDTLNEHMPPDATPIVDDGSEEP